MKNPMMQKVTLALSCAAVGLAVFDMTVKDARIHELTEERDIYASRFQNWSERAMRDEEAISERDDLLDKLLGEMDAVLNGEIKFEDAGEFHCTAYCTENFPHKLNTRIVVNGEEYIALRHPSGTIGFIRTALLGPVESELTKEYAAICVRWGNWRNGTPVYAVKDGMYLRALILPAKLGGATTDDLSEILANMLECQQSEKKEEKADD